MCSVSIPRTAQELCYGNCLALRVSEMRMMMMMMSSSPAVGSQSTSAAAVAAEVMAGPATRGIVEGGEGRPGAATRRGHGFKQASGARRSQSVPVGASLAGLGREGLAVGRQPVRWAGDETTTAFDCIHTSDV